MKQLCLLFCAFLSLNAFSQSNYCGTEMTQEMMDWLDNYVNRRDAFKRGAAASTKYIPVKIHIVGNDNGSGSLRTQHFLDGFCRLNAQFEQVGFYFYMYGDINFINNTNLNNHASGTRQLITSALDPVAANVFYMNSADGNCGYYSGWGDYIVIANGCAGPTNSTVAHEFGHFFSLPHTFFGWENRSANDAPRATDERVNKSNCRTTGDRFCDTPADFISNRWSCPYRLTKTDFIGEPYEVDGTLFMSYANDGCQAKFSPEQIDAMHGQVEDKRKGYLNLPEPNTAPLAEVVPVYPPHNTAQIPANFAQLKWKKVPGATYYHLQLSRFVNNPNAFNLDTLVADTSVILSNLDHPYNYKWRVRPISPGNTCTGYSDYINFITTKSSPIIPIYNVYSVSCPGQTDGSISVGVSGGTQPYSFNWSTGSSGQSITNLNPGTYTLTISEANQETLVISFDIVIPEPLQTEIEQTGTSLTAEVSGGTPPFTYQWSNGSELPENPVGDAGNYSLTVIDSRGCSVTKSFFYTNIRNINLADTRIYPNPVASGELLNLEVSVEESFRGVVDMFDYTGRKVFSLDKLFVTGTNIDVLNLPTLPRGIYVLRITGNGVNFNRKMAIL